MEIKVLYFGMIAEWKGGSEEKRMVDNTMHTQQLLDSIAMEIPGIKDINYVVALNRSMIEESMALVNGDEVSIFPPFAGG